MIGDNGSEINKDAPWNMDARRPQMTSPRNPANSTGYGRYSRQRDFYATFWSRTGPIFSVDQNCRAAFFASALTKIRRITGNPLRIIDIGCGNGWLTADLSRFGSATGLDLYVGEARMRHPKLPFVEGDILTVDLDQKFDVVVSSEVIEHLLVDDQPLFVQECAKLLSPRGWF
jgi:2-polyprenyl-3-methyl-5-hydroxy-6-metoxy-1,4-benzoquinol methylase